MAPAGAIFMCAVDVRAAGYNDGMNSASGTAGVHIQIKTRSLDKPFHYSVPSRLRGKLTKGSVVLVRFGRQWALGIVTSLEVLPGLPPAKLVDIEDIVDYPAIPAALIDLALWISEYYYCSPAAALGLTLPPGGLPGLKRAENGGYLLKAAPIKPKTARFVRLTEPRANEAGEGKAQRRVLDVLNDAGDLPLAELRGRAGVSASPVQTLARRGLVEIYETKISRSWSRYYSGKPGGSGQDTADMRPLKLNPPQRAALKAIAARLEEPDERQRSRPILLQGVAGAGKTEVYIRGIEAAVKLGGSAIILVPEISLTHQLIKRLQRRFGLRVGVYHSALGFGERFDEYSRIRAGEVDVVVGPRSALFAPLPHLKLIIIDEENDSSFKQENDPRYDARRVALQRARLEGAVLVYGTATPSLESYFRVRDRYILPERATGAAMPEVEIVDMRKENDMVFSRRLLDGINAAVGAGEKVILLLNRRGYASYLQCSHCGHVWECGNCDVSLTIHARARMLLCHHCGASEPLPHTCPVCGSAGLRRWGVGTERLEEELRRRFPEAPVYRLDADTSQGYGEGPRILEKFGSPGAAVLLGTQMVAKGHHFPAVTLAAVINADLALQFPEFRAEEQTFAILMQLAGRSGRADKPGKVLIQTWNADIDCIKMAANQAVNEFYQAELERRRRLSYPPYINLINVICLSRSNGRPRQAAEFLKQKLAAAADGEKLLGPADLFRLQGWSRSQILVKTCNIERCLAAFRPVVEKFRQPFSAKGIRIVVDVDPQWLS